MRPPTRSPTNKSVVSEQWSVNSAKHRSLVTGHWSLVTVRGQSTLEYAVFTGVVAAALVAMNVYVRRAIQANLKQVEDHINAEAIR